MSVDHKQTVIAALDTMRLGELATGERFKAAAYKKAMDGIKRMDKPLTTIEDVKDVDGIGKKIHDKIVEILATGGLKAAERMKERSDVDAMDTLLAVHGIGPVKARALIADGITDIESLRKAASEKPDLLTDAQTLGLKYYEAGIQRIPRAEMVAHEAGLLSLLPNGLTGTIVGSYRRGAANSGDVDMLVTYDPATSEKDAQKLFKGLVSGLDRAYTTDKLAGGAKKWMGYVRVGESTPRRLDLLLTPPEEYAYAILYFTGSDKFNVAFRRHCLDKGYSLNEHTLSVKREGVPVPPPMTTEADIFAFVGLKYILPTERVDGKQIIPV